MDLRNKRQSPLGQFYSKHYMYVTHERSHNTVCSQYLIKRLMKPRKGLKTCNKKWTKFVPELSVIVIIKSRLYPPQPSLSAIHTFLFVKSRQFNIGKCHLIGDSLVLFREEVIRSSRRYSKLHFTPFPHTVPIILLCKIYHIHVLESQIKHSLKLEKNLSQNNLNCIW